MPAGNARRVKLTVGWSAGDPPLPRFITAPSSLFGYPTNLLEPPSYILRAGLHALGIVFRCYTRRAEQPHKHAAAPGNATAHLDRAAMALSRRAPALLLVLLVAVCAAPTAQAATPEPKASVTPAPAKDAAGKSVPNKESPPPTPTPKSTEAIQTSAKPSPKAIPRPFNARPKRRGISPALVVFLVLLVLAAIAAGVVWRRRQRASNPVPPAGGQQEGEFQF